MQIKQYPLLDLSRYLSKDADKSAVDCGETLISFSQDSFKKINDDCGDAVDITRVSSSKQTATLDIEKIKNEAFEEGKKFAMTAAESNSGAIKYDLVSMARQIHTQLSEMYTQINVFKRTLENDSVQLSFEIAKKIAGHIINNSAFNVIEDFLSQHLFALHSGTQILIKVNPLYVEMVNEYVFATIDSAKLNSMLQVVGDENLLPGDCLLEFCHGRICKDQKKVLAQLESLLKNHSYLSAEQVIIKENE